MSTGNDPVNRPAHYNAGKIEVIEAIEDWKLSFHLGNAVKYIARAGKKDASKYLEDLQKAIWYLQRRIELASENPRRPNDMPTPKETVQQPQTAPTPSLQIVPKEATPVSGKWIRIHSPENNGDFFFAFLPDSQDELFKSPLVEADRLGQIWALL